MISKVCVQPPHLMGVEFAVDPLLLGGRQTRILQLEDLR